MITEQSKCKFCGKPLYLEIDEDYARLGDMFKLIPMAACDRCADVREERRRLTDRIRLACQWVEKIDPKKRSENKPMQVMLEGLTTKYAQMVARWYGFSGMAWDPEFPAMLRDTPERWPDILRHYWIHFRQLNPQKQLS